MWFSSRVEILSWWWPLIFWKRRWRETKLANASISLVEEVRNAPKIHNAILLCILWSFLNGNTRGTLCYIPNSEICLRHVWLQQDIKFPWLFGLICAQNSVSSLVLYNGLNSIKYSELFGFNWVKIHSHIHLFLLSDYLLQTLQIYLDFMQSFPLSKSELLYSVLLLKHSLRDLFNYSFCHFMYLRLVITL